MFKTMTLGECAKYDHETQQKSRLTAWGKLCAYRQQAGISRKAIRRLKKAKENN